MRTVSITWLMILLGVFLIASCEQLPKTKSGVAINFIRGGNGVNPNHGEIISLNMTYASEDGKMLFDTREIGAPVQIMFDTSQWKYGGMLYEVLELLEIDDSVQFEIPAQDLYEVSFQGQIPDSIDSDADIIFNLGFKASVPQEVLRVKRESERAVVEAGILDNFLLENGIDAQTTTSGLRYVITKSGDGSTPRIGEEVSVHYEGTLLNGNVFDSSYGKSPFTFYLGYGQVIKGWDEGIALINKGSKATLYIPSSLGYGEVGSGRVIPSNSILKFDVELVSIKTSANN